MESPSTPSVNVSAHSTTSTNVTATRPAFLSERGLQRTSPEDSIPEEEAAEAFSDDTDNHPKFYYDLSPEAQDLCERIQSRNPTPNGLCSRVDRSGITGFLTWG